MKRNHVACRHERRRRGWSAESEGTSGGDKNGEVHGDWSMQDLQNEVKDGGLYLNGHVSHWLGAGGES